MSENVRPLRLRKAPSRGIIILFVIMVLFAITDVFYTFRLSSTCLFFPQHSPEKLERSHRYVLVGAEGGGGMSADPSVQTGRGGAAALLFAKPQTSKWY